MSIRNFIIDNRLCGLCVGGWGGGGVSENILCYLLSYLNYSFYLVMIMKLFS
jgi:hypothetical protein